MKYINQLDFPHHLYVTRANPEDPGHERGKTTTIRASGCGLCSAIMVADRLLPAYDFDLYDAINLSYEVKANLARGTNRVFFPAFAEKLGLRLENTDDPQALLSCLRTGGAAVVLVGGDREGQVGLFTHGGHYMAVISQEPDGRLAILDPGWDPAKFDEPDRKGRVEITHGKVVLCDVPTFTQQARTDVPPYYLFWRG